MLQNFIIILHYAFGCLAAIFALLVTVNLANFTLKEIHFLEPLIKKRELLIGVTIYFLLASCGAKIILEIFYKSEPFDEIREELKKELADINHPPELNRLKIVAEQKGLTIEDFLARLEEGSKFDQGLRAFAEQRYNEAAILFEENAVNIENEAAQSWFYIGNALYQNAKYQEAAEALQKSIHFNPTSSDTLNNLGVTLTKLEQYKEAIEKYKLAVKYKPDRDSTWSNWGVALDGLGKYKEAIEKYQTSVRLNPNNILGVCT